MDSYDEIIFLLFWTAFAAAVVAGFVLGFYSGAVSIRAVNRFVEKNKKKFLEK